jgi:hypothetical protein
VKSVAEMEKRGGNLLKNGGKKKITRKILPNRVMYKNELIFN